MKLRTSVSLQLPEWITTEIDGDALYPGELEKMELAIRLARMNVEHRTGGPFGAAIFREPTGELISVGVNRVVPETCSVAHAEMMAYMLAEAALGIHRLNENSPVKFTLASSAQPCAMCFGALPWSGVEHLLFGARSEDVENLTNFDEGPVPSDWETQLTKRGITVRKDILRSEACDVLSFYQKTHGISY